ncbi:MAG: PorT family protein [Flavobacteriaceae bacterium]|nr:PorT family protein [Flavobacteriaceae bacterium]
MKKIFLTAMVAVLSVVSIHAQASFGVKAGVNLSNFTGDVEDNSSLTGFHIGGVVEIKLSDKFSLQPELLLVSQGASFEYDDGEFYSSDINLTYLNIPVMAKYYVMDGLSLEFGPQIGVLLSAKNKGTVKYLGEVTSFDNDIADDIEKIDLGLNFGAGYTLENNMFFQVRYNLGLLNISEESDYFKMKNSVFQFSVGYKFN